MARVFDSEFQWNFRSNSGRQTLSGNFAPTWRLIDGKESVLTDLSLVSLWPDRSEEEFSYLKLAKDFQFSMPQATLQKDALLRLVHLLEGWLKDNSQAVCVELSSEINSQKIELYIGPSRTGILAKTALEMTVWLPSIDKAVFVFDTDQSCVRLFIEELMSSLPPIA